MTDKPQKPVNPYRISAAQLAENEGYEDKYEMLEEIGHDSVVPACCKDGCQVEPDGRCEHGCPSLLLVLGVI